MASAMAGSPRHGFHRVFVRCRDEGVRLHRNFLPLGIALAGLHEHLAGLGGGFDVQEAFRRAREREGSPQASASSARASKHP